MPTAEEMAAYETIHPGAAKFFFDEMAANNKHYRETNTISINGPIDLASLGLIIGVVVIVLLLGTIVLLACLGHVYIAGALTAPVLAAAVAGFYKIISTPTSKSQ